MSGRGKLFREYIRGDIDDGDMNLFIEGLELVVDELVETLGDSVIEGKNTGAITNTLASRMVSGIRKLGSRVRNSKDVETKVDLVSQQLNMMVGVVLLGIVSSQSSQGLVGRGSKMLAYVKALGSR